MSLVAVHSKEAVLWYQLLRHPSYGILTTWCSSYGFKISKGLCDRCDVCHKAKQTRNYFSLSESRVIWPFGLVHCDLCGCYHTLSYFGCHYFLYIMDDYSRAVWVFLLKDKGETFKCLMNFWSMLDTHFCVLIQRVGSDNGREFYNGPLKEFFAQKGKYSWNIVHGHSTIKQTGRM